MADTNSTELTYAVQTGFTGTLPDPADWRIIERSDISAFGNTITKAEPTRISRNRNARRKKTQAIDSTVEFTAPLDFDSALEFGQGFAMGMAAGPSYFVSTAATATGVTVPAVPAGSASQLINGQTIIGLKGFKTETNNGHRILGGAVAANATSITLPNMTAEAVASNRRAEVYIAGVRGAAGDFEIDADQNLISTVLDFTTLGLAVGQFIHIGGVDDVNTFAEDENSGFAQVTAIAANKLTLAKRDQAYTLDDGNGVQVDILFGPYIRNYSRDNAKFLRRYYMFGLKTVFENGNPTTHEYALDNACDSLSLEVQTDGFAELSFGFLGSITNNPSTVQASGEADAAPYNATAEYSTATDLIRLSIDDVDESGLMTDFDNLTLTMANGLSARKVMGKLKAAQINLGKLAVTTESTALFNDADVIERIRCDKQVSLRLPLWNDDGGIYFHVPKMTLEGGDRSYPENESVTINSTGTAFNEDIDGSSIEISMFPVLPTRQCA